MTDIFKEDQQAGLRCGVNDMGRLFMGDTLHGICLYDMEDTPENREKLLSDFDYSATQRIKSFEPPKVMQAGEWLAVDYKFQTNAAHVAAIFDELERKLQEGSRGKAEIPAFLDGVKTALFIVSANSSMVFEWCHMEEINRNLGE